jgi:hypothetical protein
MKMIFNHSTKGAVEFNSLSVTEDADGRQRVWAYATSGATAKTPCIINFSPVTPFGYMAVLGSLATATGAASWVGIPEKTLTSGESGLFQIGGIASQCILASSITGSAYVPVEWSSASGLVSSGASCSSSLYYRMATGTSICGVFAGAQTAATTTHDIFLFGQLMVIRG